MDEAAPTLPLLVWLSPAFPVGSFAYSHGLEQAAQAGAITDRGSAQRWIEDLLDAGGLRNDAILLTAAWRACRDRNAAEATAINELALAMATSRERYLETSTQGNAFIASVAMAWPDPALTGMRQSIDGDIAYPVAVGLAAGTRAIALVSTLEGYLVALISSLASALVRLAVIGQSDGQRLMSALAPQLAALAQAAAASTIDDLGGAAFRSDLAAIAHETLETRLFRS